MSTTVMTSQRSIPRSPPRKRHRSAVADRRSHAHRLRLAAARHVSWPRRTARPRQRQETKEKFGWPLEPDFYVPDDVLAFCREAGAKGAQLEAEWRRAFDAWKAANPSWRAQLERTLRATSRRPAVAEFNAENGSVATRDAGGTVMNAIAGALPELVGGSADLDPSTKTYLKDFGDFQPGNYAGRNIHFGVREHGMAAIATGSRCMADLCRSPRPSSTSSTTESRAAACGAERPARDLRLHARLGLSRRRRPDAPADRAVRDAACDPELRRHPSRRLARNVLEAWKSRSIRKRRPYVLVLTRQKVPFLGARDAHVGRAPTCSPMRTAARPI